jgi:hypothetical protein
MASGHGCGCAEYDPAEPVPFVEAVCRVRNRLEMARVYADLVRPMKGESVSGYSIGLAMKEAPALNAAILARWSAFGLAYIKRLAWRMP